MRTLHQFAERWREAGHLSEKAFAELQPQWKEAMAAAGAALEQAQKLSIERRNALIEEARVLGEAAMLRIDAVKALQQRWQAEAQSVPLDRRHEQKLWDAFRKPRKLGLPAGTRLVVVTKGIDGESLTAVAQLAPPGIPTIMSTEAFADYDVPGSPYFVQVHGPTGRVRGEGTGPDWDQVSSLLSQASGDTQLASSLAGSVVPKPDADAEREARIDRELNAAGVPPGHASLYGAEDAEAAAEVDDPR